LAILISLWMMIAIMATSENWGEKKKKKKGTKKIK
jgi:hypothetical protein